MKAAAQNLQVEQIPVNQIQASPTNPRKHYDQATLEELAASIKSVGVQVPLSLRIRARGDSGDPAFLEIVGGERRWRAAQIAGLTSVPAIARVMTDAECRESQLVDNLQRADLSPMEEAECYEQLQSAELPIEVLAAKVGKTVQYVTQRLRLLQLIPDAREAMRQGVLNLTLALLVARLATATQEKAALYAVDPRGFMKGSLAEKVSACKARIDADEVSYWRCASESQMRDWIADNTLLPLKGVAWRLDDVDLIPGAGPCTTCPKRAGNAAMLFGDLAADGDTCTDPECYGRKQKAATKEALKAGAGLVKLLSSESYLPLKEGATSLKQGQWLPAKSGSCPQVMEGVTEEGHRKTVCGDQKCKVHKHQVQQPMAKGQSAGNWEAQQKENEAKRAAYVEAERPIRTAVYAAIRPKLKGAKLLRAAADLVLQSATTRAVAMLRNIPVNGDGWSASAAPVRAALTKAKDAEMEGWLADLIAADSIDPGGFESDDDRASLWALGKLVGVDCDAIAKKATPAVTKAAPATAAKAKPVKKKVAPKKLSAEGRKRIAEAMKKRWGTTRAGGR